jgi:hypothetical protein
MVTTWPKNFPANGTGAERLAQRITTMTGGQLELKVFAAGDTHGVQLRRYSDDLAFRRRAVGWARISDQGYLAVRALLFA